MPGWRTLSGMRPSVLEDGTLEGVLDGWERLVSVSLKMAEVAGVVVQPGHDSAALELVAKKDERPVKDVALPKVHRLFGLKRDERAFRAAPAAH